MIHAILPEVGAGLGTDVAGASAGITAYLIPFAALLLVSGNLGNRLGLVATVRVALLVYAAGSILCALAPSLGWFIVGRGVQGAANAFTSPLLVALLIERIPAGRRGRGLGAYASAQAAGQAFAPLVGGLAALWSYRWAFVAAAVVAVVVCLLVRGRPQGPGVGHHIDGGTIPPAREDSGALGRRVGRFDRRLLVRAAVVATLGQFVASALVIVGGVVGDDRFGLDPLQRGLIVSGFGIGGILSGPWLGRLADRYGTGRLAVPFIVVVALAAGLVVVAPTLWLLGAFSFVGGVAATMFRLVVQNLALKAGGTNVAAAMSLTMAAQFLGTAAVPLVMVNDALPPLMGAAILLGMGCVAAWLARGRKPT